MRRAVGLAPCGVGKARGVAFDIGKNTVALFGLELADGLVENLPILRLLCPLALRAAARNLPSGREIPVRLRVST
jgi:hypothetical protein